ncbi:PREDICTED: uncharacterized protein LOC101371213 [Odobenus rosmarus divergens]|uniref:Uncharacterized protein LOC101371213 n=1 Tax=Odobenus rosmarus divergens TaxID=9708 RepID=A0A2U3WC74_ODORO
MQVDCIWRSGLMFVALSLAIAKHKPSSSMKGCYPRGTLSQAVDTLYVKAAWLKATIPEDHIKNIRLLKKKTKKLFMKNCRFQEQLLSFFMEDVFGQLQLQVCREIRFVEELHSLRQQLSRCVSMHSKHELGCLFLVVHKSAQDLELRITAQWHFMWMNEENMEVQGLYGALERFEEPRILKSLLTGNYAINIIWAWGARTTKLARSASFFQSLHQGLRKLVSASTQPLADEFSLRSSIPHPIPVRSFWGQPPPVTWKASCARLVAGVQKLGDRSSELPCCWLNCGFVCFRQLSATWVK